MSSYFNYMLIVLPGTRSALHRKVCVGISEEQFIDLFLFGNMSSSWQRSCTGTFSFHSSLSKVQQPIFQPILSLNSHTLVNYKIYIKLYTCIISTE